MTKIRSKRDGSTIIIGTSDEIKSIEKSMHRAWKENRSNVWPSHLDDPKFNPSRIYGIIITPEERHDVYYILNGDGIVRELFPSLDSMDTA